MNIPFKFQFIFDGVFDNGQVISTSTEGSCLQGVGAISFIPVKYDLTNDHEFYCLWVYPFDAYDGTISRIINRVIVWGKTLPPDITPAVSMGSKSIIIKINKTNNNE